MPRGGQKRKKSDISKPSFFFFFFLSFMAAPTAYGVSQVRDRIRAAAAGLHHSRSDAGSELRL